jgi:hypothetical protein
MSATSRKLGAVMAPPNHWRLLVGYLEAMTDLEPRLSAEEREDLQAWYRSPNFTRDSDWPGWQRHLGERPKPPHRLKLARRP